MDVQNVMIRLTKELQYNIFSFLDENSLAHCLSVCTVFHKTIKENKDFTIKFNDFLQKKWGFCNGFPNKLVQLVGGFKNYLNFPVFNESVFVYDPIEPEKISAPVLRRDSSIFCHIKETNMDINSAMIKILVIFENSNTLLCHYDGSSDLCSELKTSTYTKLLNENHFKTIQSLLQGNEVITEVKIRPFHEDFTQSYKAELLKLPLEPELRI